MDVLGFFTLFSSPLFLLTTVLLAGSIIGCTLHRMPLLWRKATRPLLHVTDGFFDHAKLRETIRGW